MTGRARVAVVCVCDLPTGGREPCLVESSDLRATLLTTDEQYKDAIACTLPWRKRVCLCRVLRGRKKQRKNPHTRSSIIIVRQKWSYTTTLEIVICMSKFFQGGSLFGWDIYSEFLEAQQVWMTGNFNSFAAIFWFKKFLRCSVNWFFKKLPSFSFTTLYSWRLDISRLCLHLVRDLFLILKFSFSSIFPFLFLYPPVSSSNRGSLRLKTTGGWGGPRISGHAPNKSFKLSWEWESIMPHFLP